MIWLLWGENYLITQAIETFGPSPIYTVLAHLFYKFQDLQGFLCVERGPPGDIRRKRSCPAPQEAFPSFPSILIWSYTQTKQVAPTLQLKRRINFSPFLFLYRRYLLRWLLSHTRRSLPAQAHISRSPVQNYAVTPAKMPDITIPNAGAVKLQTPNFQTLFPIN